MKKTRGRKSRVRVPLTHEIININYLPPIISGYCSEDCIMIKEILTNNNILFTKSSIPIYNKTFYFIFFPYKRFKDYQLKYFNNCKFCKIEEVNFKHFTIIFKEHSKNNYLVYVLFKTFYKSYTSYIIKYPFDFEFCILLKPKKKVILKNFFLNYIKYQYQMLSEENGK
jgi:hypothetical protein